jgi:hypothetical protein
MKRAHLVVGLAGIVLFLASGLYMHFGYDHLRGLDSTTRLLFRSGHINLLWIALVNVALGLHLRPAAGPCRGWLQRLGSLPILTALPLLLVAFLWEPALSDLYRPYSRTAIIASAVGIFFLLLSGWPAGPQPNAPKS